MSQQHWGRLKIWNGTYGVYLYAILPLNKHNKSNKVPQDSNYRDKSHFSREANQTFDSYFRVVSPVDHECLDSIGLDSLKVFVGQKRQLRGVTIQFQMDLWLCNRRSFESMVLVFKPKFEYESLAVEDVLFINHALRHYYDELIGDLQETANKHASPAGGDPDDRANKVWSELQQEDVDCEHGQSPIDYEGGRGGNHYCKMLSYFVINNKYRRQIIRWDHPTYDLTQVLQVASRFKMRPFTGDDVSEPNRCLLNPPETDRYYQQWASTRYATTPMGTAIVSLAHQLDDYVRINTDPHLMPKWVEMRYLPIMILVHFQQVILHKISAEAQRDSRGRFRSDLLKFRREIWLYTVANDIQDERIWEEAKKANRLDELFEALNDQVRDEAQERLNFNIKLLTILEVLIGSLSLIVAVLSYCKVKIF